MISQSNSNVDTQILNFPNGSNTLNIPEPPGSYTSINVINDEGNSDSKLVTVTSNPTHNHHQHSNVTNTFAFANNPTPTDNGQRPCL